MVVPRGIPIPPDSRIPRLNDDAASCADHDRYFDLRRDRVGLIQWTQGCLSLERELLADLEASGLTDADQNNILVGILILYRTTLERWMHPSRIDKHSV